MLNSKNYEFSALKYTLHYDDGDHHHRRRRSRRRIRRRRSRRRRRRRLYRLSTSHYCK